MSQELAKEPAGYQWALPENLDIPRDELKVRLDFYGQSVVMYVLEGGIVTTKMVSPRMLHWHCSRTFRSGRECCPKTHCGGSTDKTERRRWHSGALHRCGPSPCNWSHLNHHGVSAADARTDLHVPPGGVLRSVVVDKETANDTGRARLPCSAL